ncbi:NAD(P)-dependent oxidoreductase [Glaciibacter flavus]|uniref:NAD(P)-dependent oxidoreductase n=1 Tax=Orlajensenia flava TaxID=2565934 RepID=UPI003B00A352
MARIIILGGHGKVALHLERLLVERGDEVDAVIRNPAHAPDVLETGAHAVVLDLENSDQETIADVLADHDAVVWSAGAGGGSADRTYAVDRDAAIRSMDAARTAGVKRYVMVSYFGAGPDHGVPEDNPFFAYADAKAAADEHLRASDADWTVLGPSTLTDGPGTGGIDVDATESGSVDRADVAAVAAAVLADDGTIGRTIRFNAGSVPIAEAIG